jgi:hypothetical protein
MGYVKVAQNRSPTTPVLPRQSLLPYYPPTPRPKEIPMNSPYTVGTILRHHREQTLWMLTSISLSGLPVLSEVGTDRQSLFTRMDLVNYFEVIG